MKKEELMKLEGMTEELATKIAELSADELKGMIPKSRLDEVIKERDDAKAAKDDVLKELGALQKETGDVQSLKDKIKGLEDDAKEKEKTHAAELRTLKIENAVDTTLLGAKALNVKAVKALLNLENAELDEDGTVKGLADQIKALQAAEDSKFLFGSSAPNMKGAKIGESGNDDGDKGMTIEKFRKMSPAERYNYSITNPNEYKQLYGGN
jgi:autonomous glycyl radical cofactor GrcA